MKKKKLESNLDNIHPDILEVHQLKLTDRPYDYRQRRKQDDVYAGKGTFDGITEEHFRKAFKEDEKVLETYFNSDDFHSGAYWGKLFMLDGVYNLIHKLVPQLNKNELDVVISVDSNGKPELEVKYWDYEFQEWTDINNIIEVVDSNPDGDGGEEAEPELDNIDVIEDYKLKLKSVS